jgi:hypothetical protein
VWYPADIVSRSIHPGAPNAVDLEIKMLITQIKLISMLKTYLIPINNTRVCWDAFYSRRVED